MTASVINLCPPFFCIQCHICSCVCYRILSTTTTTATTTATTCQSTVEQPGTTSPQLPPKPAQPRQRNRKRPAPMTNATFMRQSLALQAQQMRQRLAVERRKADALETIATEVLTIRSLISAATNIEVTQMMMCSEQ